MIFKKKQKKTRFKCTYNRIPTPKAPTPRIRTRCLSPPRLPQTPERPELESLVDQAQIDARAEAHGSRQSTGLVRDDDTALVDRVPVHLAHVELAVELAQRSRLRVQDLDHVVVVLLAGSVPGSSTDERVIWFGRKRVWWAVCSNFPPLSLLTRGLDAIFFDGFFARSEGLCWARDSCAIFN